MKYLYVPLYAILAQFIVYSAQAQISPNERTINVMTYGEAKIWPDVAQMTFRFVKENPLASRALIEIREETKRFQTVLGKIGLDDSVQVTERGIVIGSQNSRYRTPGQPQGGFTVSNEFVLEFPLKDQGDHIKVLDQVAKIADSLNPEGFLPVTYPNASPYGNEQSIVQYGVSNLDDVENQIYQEAMAKNRPEAENMAKMMHVKITGIRSSNLNTQTSSYRYGMNKQQYPVSGSVYEEFTVVGTFNATYIVEAID